MICFECDGDTVEERVELISFEYIGGVEFTAMVPVMRCQECKFGWTDYRTEEIKDRIVKEYNDQRQTMETSIRRSQTL